MVTTSSDMVRSASSQVIRGTKLRVSNAKAAPKCGVAQFQLVHIHPFVDGNGRTSRLLSTLCLYRAGYDFKRLFSISEYYDRNRTGFYTALQSVREHEMDLTGWLDYFVEGLATQMDEVTERGKRAIRRDVIAREYALNHATGAGSGTTSWKGMN